MGIKIALAGNPNAGKTTLFNALTGSNQFVGNWPGVTVEKKEGKLKGHKDVIITDLPGIYSLSPYTLEEVVARNYLIQERPDAILNIIDGTNLERNLYLTTQLVELGIPVVVAINMMDIVRKNGDQIRIDQLAKELGCKVVEISALKGTGIDEAAKEAMKAAESKVPMVPQHKFGGCVEHAIAHIEEACLHDQPEEQQRWYAIKIFERDDKVLEQLNIPEATKKHVEQDIEAAEKEMDDDAESIITNERYLYIASIIKDCLKKKKTGMTTSDKIDKIVTNRWLGLPILDVYKRQTHNRTSLPPPAKEYALRRFLVQKPVSFSFQHLQDLYQKEYSRCDISHCNRCLAAPVEASPYFVRLLQESNL